MKSRSRLRRFSIFDDSAEFSNSVSQGRWWLKWSMGIEVYLLAILFSTLPRLGRRWWLYRGLRQRVWEWAWHRGSRWPISCQGCWPPPTTTRSTSPNIHIDLVVLADRLPPFDPQPIVDKPEGTALTNIQENSTLARKRDTIFKFSHLPSSLFYHLSTFILFSIKKQ